MLDIRELFYGRTADIGALKNYGFEEKDGEYIFSRPIVNGQFTLTVKVAGSKVSAQVYDGEADSPYYLFAVEGAEGPFVGEVRAEYEKTLLNISEKCFSQAGVYREKTTLSLISYAQTEYGAPPEFLWHDENSIMRRADNKKWFLLIMIVPKSRLGLEGEGRVEVANMLGSKEEIPALLDGVNFLPAYHMNKQSWFTVPLDGRVDIDILRGLLDRSYILAGKAAAKR